MRASKHKFLGQGLTLNERMPKKMANKDPWRHIPFVEPEPPRAGPTYWLVCAVVIGAIGAMLYLGVGK